MKIRHSATCLVGLIAGSARVAAHEAPAHWRDVEPTSAIAAAWPVLPVLLLALWVIEDSKAFPDIRKPFEYGFLVFRLAPPCQPYDPWRTRRTQGVFMRAGFVAPCALGYLAQLAICSAS